MRKKFLKEVKPLPEDITKFESGIDVDSASDSMAKKPDTEFLREFFGRVEIANFLVPYRENINKIPLIDIKEKGKMIPIFSSFAAFEKSPLPKDKAGIMHFDKINDIVKKSNGQIGGIVINPHGKSMVFKHSGAKVPENKPGTGIKLMKPAMVPAGVAETLKNYLSSCEKVYSAYILWAQKENDLAPHLFMVIDFDGKREEFFPKVAEAIKPVLKPGDNIEMAKADFKLLKTAEKLVPPVYKKP